MLSFFALQICGYFFVVFVFVFAYVYCKLSVVISRGFDVFLSTSKDIG